MKVICFPFERVIEINMLILATEPGMKGQADILKLQGALVVLIMRLSMKVWMMFLRLRLNILLLLQWHMHYRMRTKEQD